MQPAPVQRPITPEPVFAAPQPKMPPTAQPPAASGAAHGALAMTTPGDTTMASLKEVEKLVGGGGARVDR